MERIPEPELMDDPVQVEAYATADFAEAHDSVVAHFGARFPEFGGGQVLDLGCGPADVTIRFARAHPAASVVGVDAAERMLDWGRRAIAEGGLADRVAFEQRRLPDPEGLGGRAFDAVISNSLLHHLADPAVLWEAALEAAAPGAPVFVMDLLRPASREAAEALTAMHADGAPEVLRHDFFHSLLAAYRPDEVRAQLAAAGAEGFAVEVVSDRHLVAWGRAPGRRAG